MNVLVDTDRAVEEVSQPVKPLGPDDKSVIRTMEQQNPHEKTGEHRWR
jgi:hypothetical protein